MLYQTLKPTKIFKYVSPQSMYAKRQAMDSSNAGLPQAFKQHHKVKVKGTHKQSELYILCECSTFLYT